jgi:hypothetical protein
MVFASHVVNVILDQLILVGKLEDDGKEAEKLVHNFFVTLPAEVFDLLDMVLQNGRLSTLVVPVKFGEVVDLDVVDDRFRESEWSADSWVLLRSRSHILPESSRAVAVVLAIVQVLEVVVLQLLLQRQVVELAAQSELSIDFFLADAEVLDVEEAHMLGSICQLLGELLLAFRSVE